MQRQDIRGRWHAGELHVREGDRETGLAALQDALGNARRQGYSDLAEGISWCLSKETGGGAE